MVYYIEDGGLHELSLHYRCYDLYKGLSGEDNLSLRDRPYGSRESEILKIIQKVLLKDPESSEIFYVLFLELQLLDILYHLLQACHHRISALHRIGAVEHVKDDRPVRVLVLEVSLHHRQLIQVC